MRMQDASYAELIRRKFDALVDDLDERVDHGLREGHFHGERRGQEELPSE
jgi:hypothetical protein